MLCSEFLLGCGFLLALVLKIDLVGTLRLSLVYFFTMPTVGVYGFSAIPLALVCVGSLFLVC